MNNQNTNLDPNMAVQNMYDPNIDNSRVNATPSSHVGTNPYINQNMVQPNPMNQPVQENQTLGFNNGDFVKGALIGAAVTFLLTNKGAQENIMQAVSKGSELFQAGMEELKERYEDARAQMETHQE